MRSPQVLLCGILLVLQLGYAQIPPVGSCQPYMPILTPVTGSMCSNYVSPYIWVPFAADDYLAPYAQPILDGILNSTGVFGSLKAYLPVVPLHCYNNMLAMLCTTTFPPCNFKYIPELNVTVGLPSYPCKSTCEGANLVCGPFYATTGLPAPDCTVPSSLGGPQYPEFYYYTGIQTNTSLGNITLESACFPYDQLPNQYMLYSYNKSCPYPTVRTQPQHITNTTPICDMPCPDLSWSPHQWMTLGHIQFAFAFIAFILMAFLSIHYVVDPSKRHITKRFQLYSFLCQMMFAAAFLVGGPDPSDTLWCTSPTQMATLSHPACGAQAILFLVFALAASIWWSICSTQLYLHLERRENTTFKHELTYIALAFGIPSVLCIVAAREDTLFFYYLSPVCFIQGDIPHTDFAWHLLLFYLPMCIPMIIAIFFNCATIFKLVKHMRSMHETFRTHAVNGKVSLFLVNLRLFLWCIFLFIFFFTLVVYRWGQEEDAAGIAADAFAWTGCKVNAQLGILTYEQEQASCPTPTYPNDRYYGGTLFYYIIIVSMGTFSFITFGTSRTVSDFWFILLKSILEGKWDQAKDMVTNEKAFIKLRQQYVQSASTAYKLATLASNSTPTTDSNKTPPEYRLSVGDGKFSSTPSVL